MNKCLLAFSFGFISCSAYAVVPTEDYGGHIRATVYNFDNINFTEIKNTPADEYWFDNSVVFIDDFSDWQSWIADVHFNTNVSLRIKNLGMSNNGEKLKRQIIIKFTLVTTMQRIVKK